MTAATQYTTGGRIPADLLARHMMPDGSLRDVYVLETTLSDWQSFMAFVREREPDIRLEVDDRSVPMPDDVSSVFALRGRHALSAGFRVGGALLSVHFFCIEEIEIDLDPKELQSHEALVELQDFMVELGRRLGKGVLLTPENSQNTPFLRWDHASQEMICIKP